MLSLKLQALKKILSRLKLSHILVRPSYLRWWRLSSTSHRRMRSRVDILLSCNHGLKSTIYISVCHVANIVHASRQFPVSLYLHFVDSRWLVLLNVVPVVLGCTFAILCAFCLRQIDFIVCVAKLRCWVDCRLWLENARLSIRFK